MRLNPLQVVRDFKEGYIGFLDTYLTSRYEYINKKIADRFSKELFVKGPYIQFTPPYKKGKFLSELVHEGILEEDILKIFPKDIHLYVHQEKVIRNTVEKGRNSFVATGTGSGKTISFLIPVLNYILKTKKEKGKGVKAIFLYPMNALANDQINTLRNILKGKDVDITFGKYTGDTPHNKSDFKEKIDSKKYNYEQLKKECPNHLLTREEILTQIPDILITNYSMLEFLLLRPKDTPLFDKKTFKFIVIDEIHVYDGAKGTEIGYLLRRLKSRAFEENPICIGASATIGEINDENLKKAAMFAKGIFGEDFGKEDVITSTVIHVLPKGKPWYQDLDFKEILKIADSKNLTNLKNYLKSVKPDGNVDGDSIEEVLFNFFENYEPLHFLLEKLKVNPMLVQDIVKDKDSKIKDTDKILDLINILFLAKKEVNGIPLRLLDARYHTFVKGTEGLYASLNESGTTGEIFKEIFMEKKIEDDDGHKVFQLCSCSNCGEIFLTGYAENKGSFSILDIEPTLLEDPFRIDRYGRTFIYIPHGTPPFDERFLKDEKNRPAKAKKIWFDPVTGHIYDEEMEDTYEAYILTKNKDGFDQPMECPNCGINEGKTAGRKSFWISYFTPDQEYPQANILELLYKRVAEGSRKEKDKKIIVFSDSRKDAAFFAPFFEKYYNSRLNRWIVYQNIKDTPKRFERVIEDSSECYASYSKDPVEREEIKDDIKKAFGTILMDEFAMVYNDSLEKLGLVKFKLKTTLEEKVLSDLKQIKELKVLSDNELLSFLYYLLQDSRALRHVYSKDYSLSVEEAYIWKQKSGTLGYGASNWIPAIGKKGGYRETKRTRLVKNILGISDIEERVEILKKIWDILETNEILHFISKKGSQINVNNWQVQRNQDVWICQKCQKIHVWNVKDTCRDGNCGGFLAKTSLEKIKKAKALEIQFKPVECKTFKNYKVVASEHTAQLSSEEGKNIQDKFSDGKINILSCSTTFELGVDLGELEVVFMHNVPPKPDNYVQRAGRAGRSTESAAFVCTYALNRPLDLKAFENPVDMIKGNMRPPVIKVTNPRIILRHLNALSLSHFLRKFYSGADKITVKNFLDNNSFDKFIEYMDGRPQEIKDDIDKVLTNPDLRKEFGVEEWKWWDGNIPNIEDNNSKNLFLIVKKELDEYLGKLDSVLNDLSNEITQATKTNEFHEIKKLAEILDIYNKQRKKILDQDVISFFSKKVFIPKYGFPVDVVSLDIIGKNDLNSKLQLDRDLGIAIGEYAPGERIIALGNIILSTRVTTYEHLKPELRFYRYCRSCLTFEDSEKELEHVNTCSVCKSENLDYGKYIIPDRGFTTEPFKNSYTYFNEKFKEQVKKQFNIKNVLKDPPIIKMKTFSKFTPGSKLRTFFKGIKEENRIKEEKTIGKMIITPYSRGEIVRLNVSESKKIRIDNGMNITWFNDAIKRNLEKEGKVANLGYWFYTDILNIAIKQDLIGFIDSLGSSIEEGNFAVYLSLLYAIIEGASKALEIKREDLDGTIKRNPSSKQYDLIIFDNVPAGAGFIEEIYDNFEKVLKEAYSISKNCKCDEETSCSVCLLHSRNQIFSKFIKRGLARRVLEEML